LSLPPDVLTLTDFSGEPLAFGAEEGGALIPVGGHRATLLCGRIGAEQLRAALESARVEVAPALTVWVEAKRFDRIEGEMALGSQVGVEEEEALSGDVVVCTGQPSYADPQPWFTEYTVNIPRAGVWTLWARVRYPRGQDDSFGIVRPGEALTLSGEQVLGNCGQNDAAWHWTGRGAGSNMAPPGRPIRLTLDEGPFTFRIYAREGARTDLNPRLDLICLTENPLTVPDDDMAREALAGD
jgi:hypothetical protein